MDGWMDKQDLALYKLTGYKIQPTEITNRKKPTKFGLV